MLGAPVCFKKDLESQLVAMQCAQASIPEDTSGDISTTADRDDEVRLELGEDLLSRRLAELVDLSNRM